MNRSKSQGGYYGIVKDLTEIIKLVFGGSPKVESLKDYSNDLMSAFHVNLTHKEAIVLVLRTAGGMTFKEIGLVFGLSHSRIQQIQRVTLRKLRHPYSSKYLKDYCI